jgi:alpha-N-arabinofuranosidase
MFVNVNPGARQWRPNLIGYDAISAYGSPSYYALQMFNRNVGDQILNVSSSDNSIQGSATRDSRTGEIILKLVNLGAAAPVTIEINGAASVGSGGTAITLAGNPADTNSLTDPRKVLPVTSRLRHVSPQFTYSMPANGIVVLKLKSRL